MYRNKLSIATLLILLAVPLGAFGQTFGPKEIQENWVGKTLFGKTGSGENFTMKLSPDGTIEISGDAANDTGTWRLSDTGYCTTWKKIRKGTERCFTALHYQNGDVRVNNPDGSVAGIISKVE